MKVPSWVSSVVKSGAVQDYVVKYRDEPNWPKNFALAVIQVDEDRAGFYVCTRDALAEAALKQGWTEEDVEPIRHPVAGMDPVLAVGTDNRSFLMYMDQSGMKISKTVGAA